MVAVLALLLNAIVGSLPGAGIEDASRALERGVPEVAVTRLERFLATSIDSAQRDRGRLLLVEALVKSARAEEALAVLKGATAPKGPTADFWTAQAFAALNRWDEAAVFYEKAAVSPDSERRGEAAFGQAEALHKLGRMEEAAAALEPLLTHPRLGTEAQLRLAGLRLETGDIGAASIALEKAIPVTPVHRTTLAYLRGQIALAKGEAARALDLFREVRAGPRGSGEEVWAGAAIGEARALRKLGKIRESGDVLEDFIRKNAQSQELPSVFAELDAVYMADADASRAELVTWTRDAEGARRLLAEYYLARVEARAGREKRSIERLMDLRAVVPPGELHKNTLSELGCLLLANNQPAKAIEVFESVSLLDPSPAFQGWCEFMLGRCTYELKRYTEAAAHFDKASSDEDLAADALYNSALSCVRAGNFDAFLEHYAAFSARFPESSLRRDLLIEQGRFQARNGDPQAVETLGTFARDFADHPRSGEALFCIAEFFFRQNPPDLASSKESLGRARARGLEPEIQSRAELLDIWISEASGESADELIRRARALAVSCPVKSVATDARIKLGEILHRIGDFAGARQEFELAATDKDRRLLALFLAGRSAMRSMDTEALDDSIALFEEVARSDVADLSVLARREQAEVQNLKGRHDEAVLLYDDILKTEQDPRARIRALLGKGYSLFSAGAREPAKVKASVAAFDAIIADKAATLAERNEAKYMRARSLERLGDKDGALDAYYAAIEGEPEEEAEFYWHDKAGFDAARLLEGGQRWGSAIKIYEQLAAMDGPRSEEAAQRVNQLRLEHFLWETE